MEYWSPKDVIYFNFIVGMQPFFKMTRLLRHLFSHSAFDVGPARNALKPV
jgi:hypothetical protein